MKGYMGAPSSADSDDYDDDEEPVSASEENSQGHDTSKNGYDLIYILDSIYHFPPSVPHFLTTALSSLSPGGVIAYTDVLPPPNLPPWLSYWVLPTLVGVPVRNLASRPARLEEYTAQLNKIGYTGVDIEDWTDEVFPGFARFLREKGGPWTLVARGAEWAYRGGWKFVAVRAEKPKEV
jgi:SAM-dependent methyltransferase